MCNSLVGLKIRRATLQKVSFQSKINGFYFGPFVCARKRSVFVLSRVEKIEFLQEWGQLRNGMRHLSSLSLKALQS